MYTSRYSSSQARRRALEHASTRASQRPLGRGSGEWSDTPGDAPPSGLPRRSECGLVVLVASVGGLQALQTIVQALPAKLPAAVAIVQHRRARPPYMLAEILRRCSRLPVTQVEATGATVRPGTVYVAPPDHHLVMAPDGRLGLLGGRRVRQLSSSADPLLESASLVFGGGVLAVMLAGGHGSDGVRTVRLNGGTVIAREEAGHETASGPFPTYRPAAAAGYADHLLPLDEIGPAIVRLAAGESIEAAEVPV